ncbi:MAG: single-stranded DNA-binding protein [bacterium]|nr:single-stranded DNA-binding protein [bacterium]
MDLNKVMLIGRLGQDPEVRSLPSGSQIASFSLATGRQWKDSAGEKQKQTEFHRIVVWGKLADIAGQYLQKGRQIYIEGRLHTRDFTGQDGIKKYRTEVVADNFIMLGSKPNGGVNNGGIASTPSGEASSHQPKNLTQTPVSEEESEDVVEEEIRVEAIPF